MRPTDAPHYPTSYGPWPASVNAQQLRLSAHDHVLCAFAEAPHCDAVARRLQRFAPGRPHCRRLRPEAMLRRLEAAAAHDLPSPATFWRRGDAAPGLAPLARQGSHWLLVRINDEATVRQLQRALRGLPVQRALRFSELTVEDLLSRRKGRPRAGQAAARGSHPGGSTLGR
ncbi:hypothetical protein [Caldimonas sp. KR1-144]|uniref:hypothetical protein n=1 Tax=Caldimonas sp. KR1-144 TaxID=3400911 RepID=UPI003C05D520